MRYILIFLLIVVSRAAYYFYYYLAAKRYQHIYFNYLQSGNSQKLMNIKSQIRHLLQIVGNDDARIPVVQALGYGVMAQHSATPVDNLTNRREDIVTALFGQLMEAEGTCRSRALQSFNPIFWVECIVYFPAKVLAFLGLKKQNIVVKFFQLAWWLFAAFATIVGLVFNKEFTTWIKSFIN